MQTAGRQMAANPQRPRPAARSGGVESAAHDEPERSGKENEHDREDDAGDAVQLAYSSFSTLRQVSIARLRTTTSSGTQLLGHRCV